MNELVRITEENPVYCSMSVTSRAEKAILYNAVQNPTKKISDFINQKLLFINVHMEKVQYEDKETGEKRDGVKTVLIQPNGEGVICNSNGIVRSLYSLFQIFGTPETWEGEPMEVIVRQVETPKGRTFKLEVV